MATGLAVILHYDAVDEEINSRNSRMERRRLRDLCNPMEIPNAQFLQLYRLDKDTVIYLFEVLTPFLRVSRYSGSITPQKKVLTALNFYSHGSYQGITGRNHCLGLSQSSVSRCLNEVSEVICEHLLTEWVVFLTNDEDISTAQLQFFEKFNFPGVVGCVDGTHISIIKPSYRNNRQAYFNRKGYYSINAQIICGADLKILSVNALYPGCTHDAAIWHTSQIRRFLENRNARGCRLLGGDSGYPSEPWLLIPYVNPGHNTPESRYNKAHIKTRNAVERCIGLLKSRFRCILKHRVLNYSPTVAGKIFYSCAVLHNICISRNVPLHDVAGYGCILNNVIRTINDHATSIPIRGRQVRNEVIQEYFT